MNKKILFLILLGVILFPSFCFAIPGDLKTIVNNFAKNLGEITAGASIIAFIVAGIMFLTATGNPSRMTIAKGALIAAVIGIVILALSGTASKFVGDMFT